MNLARCLALATALATLAACAPLQALTPLVIGHEYRQDDLPALAAAADGSLWATWLSFAGDRDDIAIRRYRNGKWENLQWVPGASGDCWMPQVGVDSSNRVWVVWSQQVNANWDLFARRFDPAAQDWSPLMRLTSDALPDIRPRLASDGKGHFAVAWQGFRQRSDGRPAANIFLKTFDGEKWSGELRITDHGTNDWDPAVAFDSAGALWVAYDSYRNDNYDVYLAHVVHGSLTGAEIPVAHSLRFEARASVAVDGADGVWVAYEAGNTDWGKDEGYLVRFALLGIWPPGKGSVVLGGAREVVARYYRNSRWFDPAEPLAQAFSTPATYQPNLFADGHGSIWAVVRSLMHVAPPETGARPSVYYEYQATHFDGGGWQKSFALPNSSGRTSTSMGAALASDGTFWAVWPTENRVGPLWHRPHQQQILAAAFPKTQPAAEPVWSRSPQPEVAGNPPHKREAEDLAAIRQYTVTLDGKAQHIVRGDFHRHTELSWDGGGGLDGSLTDFYRYMIDVASMDFGASTDHQGGSWPYWWWYSQKMTDMYHAPGGYVPIFGYERSAFYPFGHRNVFFARRADSRITPFFVKQGVAGYQIPPESLGDEPGVATGELVAGDTRLLYEDVRSRGAVVIPHTPATNQGTNWSDNDPSLEPVVEIFQGARASSEQLGAPMAYEEKMSIIKNVGYQPSGFVVNAWAKGYKLGVITSSDHSSTHISYAMVYTADRSRQGILDAIRKRHTYGAMDNIIVDVRMGDHFMGDEFTLRRPQPLKVKLRGTDSIATVAVIRDGTVIYSVEPKNAQVEFTFQDTAASKGHHYYYVRVQQQNKLMAWSSPFFVTY